MTALPPEPSQDAPDDDFPWWLLALAVIGVGLAILIATNDLYTQVFRTVSRGVQITVFVTLVGFAMASILGLLLALMALSLFILRRRRPEVGGFAVPLYPIVPLLFLGVCLTMLWSSLGYAAFLLGQSESGRLAGILGLGLLVAGIPLVWKAR